MQPSTTNNLDATLLLNGVDYYSSSSSSMVSPSLSSASTAPTVSSHTIRNDDQLTVGSLELDRNVSITPAGEEIAVATIASASTRNASILREERIIQWNEKVDRLKNGEERRNVHSSGPHTGIKGSTRRGSHRMSAGGCLGVSAVAKVNTRGGGLRETG